LPAREAHPQVHPVAADLDALLALERRLGQLRDGDSVEVRTGGRGTHAITRRSIPGSGSGSRGSRRSSGPARSVATAVLLTQFRSAGTTCHGAHSLAVSAITSSQAVRYSSKRSCTSRSAFLNFQRFSGSSMRSWNRSRCSSFETSRKTFTRV